jgi:hypothetical protein
MLRLDAFRSLQIMNCSPSFGFVFINLNYLGFCPLDLCCCSRMMIISMTSQYVAVLEIYIFVVLS